MKLSELELRAISESILIWDSRTRVLYGLEELELNYNNGTPQFTIPERDTYKEENFNIKTK